MPSKLAIEDLTVTYGPIVGTHALALTLEAGETVALIGANGAGKSSTLKAVLGMASYRGRIALDGADLRGLKASEVVRRGVGYAPEGRRVFAQLSVLDNLKVGGICRERSALPERLERIYGYFPRLRERRSQRAGNLSGGEQQMLAIARALMSKPSLLMLDEPSLGLSPLFVQHIFEIIDHLHKDGLTMLIVEQNLNLTLRHAQRCYVLERGQIAVEGAADIVRDDPRTRQAYLGL